MAVPQSKPLNRPYGAFDTVRVMAVCLVTAQHALSLLGHDSATTLWGINLGQFGVAVFLGISGAFAAQSRRPPVQWLGQRLLRLFPAYWLVMAVSFVMTWWIGYKYFDTYQVLAQMLGVGLFTHPGGIVNTPTWFISILLVCYAGVFLARLTRHPALVAIGAAVALAAWVGVTTRPWLVSHFLTFTVAGAIAVLVPLERGRRAFLAVGVVFMIAAWWHFSFAYTGLTLVLLGLASRASGEPGWVRALAEYSYEYYLVHGICLFGMIQVLRVDPVLAVASGIGLSALAAVLIRTSVNRLVRALVTTQQGNRLRHGSYPAVAGTQPCEGAASVIPS